LRIIIEILTKHVKISMMIDRQTLSVVSERLHEAPAVVLLGPRQVGKTTLAFTLADT
jgi:predicted AAA+ superfamily ATPase